GATRGAHRRRTGRARTGSGGGCRSRRTCPSVRACRRRRDPGLVDGLDGTASATSTFALRHRILPEDVGGQRSWKGERDERQQAGRADRVRPARVCNRRESEPGDEAGTGDAREEARRGDTDEVPRRQRSWGLVFVEAAAEHELEQER